MRLIVQSFPNREIRAFVSHEPPRKELGDGSDSAGSSKESDARGDSKESVDSADREDSDRVPELDITSEVATGTQKSGFGLLPRPTKFGTFAKRKILRVGGALDCVQSSPDEGVFLTGTVPGSTLEAFHAVACWSGWLVHRLKSWVNKRVKSQYDFYVWELQKRGALHLHYYVHIPDSEARDYILREFKAQWERLIDGVCERSGVDVWAKDEEYSHSEDKSVLQAYAQKVKKSVAAYLAKYCSKSEGKGTPGESWFCPVRWWGVSRPLNKLLESLTETVEITGVRFSEAREKFSEAISVLKGYAVKFYEYGQNIGTGLNAVGYVPKADQKGIVKEMLARMGMTMQENQDAQRYYQCSAKLKRSIMAILSDPKRKAVLDAQNQTQRVDVIYGWLAGAEVDMYEFYTALENAILGISEYFHEKPWFGSWAREFFIAGGSWMMMAADLVPSVKVILDQVPSSRMTWERRELIMKHAMWGSIKKAESKRSA